MKRKSIKNSSIMNVAIYAVIIMVICPVFSGVMALESTELPGVDQVKTIMESPDPFSLPSMLKQLLDDADRKAREEEERQKRKNDPAFKVASKDTDAVKVSPPPEKPPEFPSLEVTGIIFSKSKPLAIINGDVFGVGEVIRFPVGGVTIRSIEKDRVIVTFIGDSHVLFVDEESQNGTSKKK